MKETDGSFEAQASDQEDFIVTRMYGGQNQYAHWKVKVTEKGLQVWQVTDQGKFKLLIQTHPHFWENETP